MEDDVVGLMRWLTRLIILALIGQLVALFKSYVSL
jgi:hypothetical protein